MSIALHVNLCLMLDTFSFYGMLVHMMLICIRYEGKFAKQTRSLRVGVVLDIPRSLFLKIDHLFFAARCFILLHVDGFNGTTQPSVQGSTYWIKQKR